MSNEPQLFRVNPDNKESERIEEVDFATLGLQERRDIQEWVADNPGILGDDLLIIGKEFSGFDRTNERLDLLAVDSDGKLVVIELKRDDTGADAHWQAIKYASYLHRASADSIVRMRADYADISQEEAANELLERLGADDLNALNNDQRIILASHRFAPEVTSAALWLNEKAPGENLITCVRLTPYRDPKTDSLYVQASTIIPIPGVDEYVVGIGGNSQETSTTSGSSFAVNLKKTFDRNKNDEVTHFLRRVGEMVVGGLEDDIVIPDKTSRWAGGGPNFRYYHFWYSRPPWSNWGVSYRVNIGPLEGTDTWWSNVEFKNDRSDLKIDLTGIRVNSEMNLDQNGVTESTGNGSLNDEFANHLASATRNLIEQITPIVDDLENESD